MLNREAQRVATQALPTLESFSLLYGGIGLLHRSSVQEFDRAQEVLSALAERVPRHGSPRAWLAKWHCLRIIRGQAGDVGNDRSRTGPCRCAAAQAKGGARWTSRQRLASPRPLARGAGRKVVGALGQDPSPALSASRHRKPPPRSVR